MYILIFESMDVEKFVFGRESVERRIFLINHQEEDMVVHLDKDKYWDILNEEQVEDMLIVGGRNVVVLKPL